MTDNEIIIAVAELDGFKHSKKNEAHNKDERNSVTIKEWYREEENGVAWTDKLPNYLTSRDAIIPVIEKQHPETLFTISLLIKEDTFRSTLILAGMLATPRQLCIALLKATGKWKD